MSLHTPSCASTRLAGSDCDCYWAPRAMGVIPRDRSPGSFPRVLRRSPEALPGFAAPTAAGCTCCAGHPNAVFPGCHATDCPVSLAGIREKVYVPVYRGTEEFEAARRDDEVKRMLPLIGADDRDQDDGAPASIRPAKICFTLLLGILIGAVLATWVGL